jgi:hypothetical protein
VVLALSDETEEPLDPSTLRVSPQGVLYCRVRGGAMPARFSRNAHFTVGERLTEGAGGYELKLGGKTFLVTPKTE